MTTTEALTNALPNTLQEASNATKDELLQEYNANLRRTIMPVTIFFGFEILIGVTGNLLALHVFLFRYKACNFRYFVVGLAVTDLISCFTTIPGEMVSQVFWYTYPVLPVCKTKAYFNQFTVICEAAYLTLIALDRYRKVCAPLSWQIHRKAALYACIAIFVIAGLVMIQTPILWGVHTDTKLYKGMNITVTVCEVDQKYRGTKYPQANILFVGIVDSIAMVIMTVLYILVVRQIVIRQRQMRRRQRDHTDDDQNTLPNVNSVNSFDTSLRTSATTTSDLCKVAEFDEDSNGMSEQNNVQNGRGVRDKTSGSSHLDRTRGSSIILRARRKTMMGFCLTVVFVVTTVLYWILIFLVSRGYLSKIEGAHKAFFFFFLRLYFVNHLINPILYGLMDPQFRKEMRQLKAKMKDVCFMCRRS